MVKPDRFLADDEKRRVLDAVREAESQTSGEIRVVIVEQSAVTSFLLAFVVGALVAVAAYLRLLRWTWRHPGLLELYLALGIGLLAAILVKWFSPPSRREMKRAARDRARREFRRLGIAKTAGATGVLVMLSLKERVTVILADRAINEKVAPGTWTEATRRVIDGVKAGRPGDGLVAAVTEIGAVLSRHFPRRGDDRNELPDDVVVK